MNIREIVGKNMVEIKDILEKIKNELLKKQKEVLKIIDLEKKEWDYTIEFDKFLSIIEEYREKEIILKNQSHKNCEIIDGIGKISMINQTNPYNILSMILIAIRTNNHLTIYLSDKLLGINSILIEIIKKIIKNLDYVNINRYEDFYKNQSLYDLVIYFGNKFEYLEFSKGLKIHSVFENADEIYVYMDDKSFKDEFLEMDKFAYYHNINIYYYTNDFEQSLKDINDFGIIKKAVIFTKDKQKAMQFFEKVKAEEVYVNHNPCKNYTFQFDERKIIYTKKMF